jgi:hypothetical protein
MPHSPRGPGPSGPSPVAGLSLNVAHGATPTSAIAPYLSLCCFDSDYSTALSLATVKDPTGTSTSANWTRYGAVFPDPQPVGSKNGAMILPTAGNGKQYYLLWGAGIINIASSMNPLEWEQGETLLAPRPGFFDSQAVVAGPPPLLLSDGNYVFLYNGQDDNNMFHLGWVILDGTNPSNILARANQPTMLSPTSLVCFFPCTTAAFCHAGGLVTVPCTAQHCLVLFAVPV